MIYRGILKIIITAVLMSGTSIAQLKLSKSVSGGQSFPRQGQRYITDSDGVIRMWVNIWGQVNEPGSYYVFDGVDLPTLFSIAGGPTAGANLKKIRLFRELPDANGKQNYDINLDKFLKSGDRGDFTKILPNDTYIIPQSMTNFLISNLNVYNLALSGFNAWTLYKLREEQTNYYQDQQN